MTLSRHHLSDDDLNRYARLVAKNKRKMVAELALEQPAAVGNLLNKCTLADKSRVDAVSAAIHYLYKEQEGKKL